VGGNVFLEIIYAAVQWKNSWEWPTDIKRKSLQCRCLLGAVIVMTLRQWKWLPENEAL
jgi:hypothetical protein